jgi:signal recognition particle receptor subunit beta
MKLLNVIVAGPAKAEKTAFIENLSDHVFHSPEQVAVGKQGDSYSVEFGRAKVDEETLLYLAGIPMGQQFYFLWERLADGLLGFVVVINAKTKVGVFETGELIARLKKLTDTPFVVVFCGATDRRDPGIVELRKKLGIPREEQVICGDPKSKETAKAVLIKLLNFGVKLHRKVKVEVD